MAAEVVDGETSAPRETIEREHAEHAHGNRVAIVWNLFVDPDLAFEAIRRRPRWLVHVVLAGAFVAAAQSYAIYTIGVQQVLAGILRNGAALDPTGALRNLSANSSGLVLGQALAALLGSFAVALGFSAVLWLSIVVVARQIDYRRVLAAVSLSLLFYSVLRALMLIATAAFSAHPESLNLREPLATNLGYFFQTNSRAWQPVLSGLDIVSLGSGVLLIRGLTRVTGLRLLDCAISVAVPWSAYLLRGAAVSLF
jgi:hypothetical protein